VRCIFHDLPFPISDLKKPMPQSTKHVGVYAFRKSALIDFYEHAPTPLELAEQIEAIRYLEMGKTIQMIETQFEGVGIDVPEDLERAKKLMS
jgi:CMP-2-keto-3-deoxyoctulosonic acid synthetase